MPTRYVRLRNGKVDQVNNVVGITIVSPDVADGYYRDTPPVVVGGAAAGGSTGSTSAQASIQVAGGVSPVSAATVAAGPPSTITATASGASSVLQDDHFTHEPLRDKSVPVALLVFTTDDGIATYDCFYKFAEVMGVFNAPPPGWVPTESR